MTPAVTQAMLMLGNTAPPGPPMPYQMNFSSGNLTPYTTDGFTFDAGFTVLNSYSEGESAAVPAGADNDLAWTASPTSGMPTPSGGYYLRVSRGSPGAQIMTLPAGMNAKYFTGWFGINSWTGTRGVRVVYDNDAVVSMSRTNGLGYVVFTQASTLSPPRLPAVADLPPGASRIVRMEFFYENAIGGDVVADDITFYE